MEGKWELSEEEGRGVIPSRWKDSTKARDNGKLPSLEILFIINVLHFRELDHLHFWVHK